MKDLREIFDMIEVTGEELDPWEWDASLVLPTWEADTEHRSAGEGYEHALDPHNVCVKPILRYDRGSICVVERQDVKVMGVIPQVS